MLLETLTRLSRFLKVETRRDETRILVSSRREMSRDIEFSSYIGLPVVKRDLIIAIFGLIWDLKWVFGLKLDSLDLFYFGSWVETAFWRDETRREITGKNETDSRNIETLEMCLETIRDFKAF